MKYIFLLFKTPFLLLFGVLITTFCLLISLTAFIIDIIWNLKPTFSKEEFNPFRKKYWIYKITPDGISTRSSYYKSVFHWALNYPELPGNHTAFNHLYE